MIISNKGESFPVINNKRIQGAYERYLDSSSISLYDVYKQPSINKMYAFEYCKTLMNDFDGTDLRVIGANTMQFSAGFVFEKENDKYFMYITKSADVAMKIK